MQFHFQNDKYVSPPGSLSQSLSHPAHGLGRSIEISIFNEHRYAFFFWNKWTQKLISEDRTNYPPSLVTLDLHQDLVYPTEEEMERLRELDLRSNKEIALYSWANLRDLNDTHILAAAYLSIIGDVYVNCLQTSFGATWEDEYLEDRYGNTHIIRKFKEYQDLENCLLESKENNVYFDIDLDFFTLINPLQPGGGSGNYTYLPDKTIKEMLHPTHPMMTWIFQRLHGITIATEPEHTGVLMESNRLLTLINKIRFKPSLFTRRPGKWGKETQWRHLRKK